ncbi:uncharacterized protein [Panulirus ornatus]|uniref:uncharacterized protein isoform X3 n=2 Tax=Panulirus ornatus TaxID=150431 RepID=UPI003A85A726
MCGVWSLALRSRWDLTSGTQMMEARPEHPGSVVRVRRKAADSTQLWPDAVVPFTFLAPEPERAIVWKGLAHWQQHTCLRFHPVNDTDLPHLQFRRLAGCRSGVGIEGTSGQNISIGDNCNKMGIVVHEIGHAVGFYHEIRRPDRDQHVVVNERNILKDELFNFYKLHWLDVSIKYDLSSVMHYHTLEWSANERTTVATRDPTLQGLIGMWKRESSQGLSHRDKLLANKMYGCLDQWLAKCNLNRNPCENEGYLGKNCTCVCPSGTRGRTCQEITGGYYDHLKSPCSLDVTYPTIISTPHYPSNYDADTWCVYRLQAPECHAPEVTVYDFQLGPRDMRDQCFHDYLEVRNDSLYDGFLKCGTDVVRGTQWVASSSVMILFFKGAEGGYRGFRAQVRFTPIPGCCETHSNSSSAVYLHTPGYPKPYTQDFHCTYGLAPEEPARVVVTVSRKDGSVAADPWTCALRLCQPNGRCYRHCRKLRQRWLGSRGLEVVLPNVASLHHLQYTAGKSPFTAEKAAYQVSFTLEDSPCHKTMLVNRSDPRGWITVGPRFFEILQCEWWFQAPRGSHVKVSVEDLYLPGHEDTYLAVNEAGEPTYPAATTRVYYRQEDTPHSFVSLEHKVSLVLQGDFITQMTMKYELYECTDEDQECEYWAVNDECEKNPLWMKPHCRRSCLRCDYSTTCENRHQDCEFWAKHDQCQENRFWMHVHCRKACGLCELCVDANTWCPRWAALGDCEGNPDYMEHFCRKSCGLCDCGGASTNHTESPAKNVTTTSTTVGRPTSTTTATPVVSDPPPHPRRNRTNKIRKKKKKKKMVTSTTTPTIKNTRTTDSWEKETTRGISINQTFKPQKRKGKNTSNKMHSSKNNLKERGHTYDDVKQLDKKETARYPSKLLSPQTPKPLDKTRTHRVLKPNRPLKPYDKNGTFDKRVSRKKKIQTASTPTPRRTTKLTVKKKFRGAGVVTAAPRRGITAAPQRRGNVSQSSRKGERVTPAHPKADNKTLTSPPVDTVAPSSTKMENVSKASLKPERLIQTSLKANGRSSVHPTADRVTPTSPLPQDVKNMSSESSVRSTKNSSVAEDDGSTTLEDPKVIYKSQEIYGEEDSTAGQMNHVSETCEQGGEHGCGRGRNDVGIPTYGNEVFLNSLVRSRHYESTTRSAAGSTDAPGQVDDAAGSVKKRKQRRHGRNKNKVRNQRRRNKNKRRKHRRRNRKNKLTTRRGHQRTRTQHPGGGRHRDSKHTENRRISRGGGGRKKQWRGGARRKENRGRSDGKGGRGDDQTPDTTRSHLPRRRQDRSRKSEMPVDGGRPKTTSPPVPRVTESRSTLHPLLTTHVIPTLSLTPIQSSIIPQSTHSPSIIQTSTTQLSTNPPPITQALSTVRSIHSLHIIQVPTTQLPSTQHPSIIQLTPTTQPPYLSTTSASPSLPLRPYATLPVPQHSISNWTPEELPPALVRTTTTASTRLAMPHRRSSPTATPTMTTMASLLTAEPLDDTLTAQCPHCPRTTETGRVAELSPAREAAASSTRQRQVEQPAPQTLHQNNVYRHHPLATNSADPPRKQGKSRKNELARRRQRLLKEQQLYRRHQMKRLLSRQKHRHNKHQFDWKESGQRNKGIYSNTSTVRHRPYSHRFTGRLHPDVSPRLSITPQKIPFHPHLGHYRRTPYSQRLTLDDRAVESSSAFPYTLNRPPIRSQQSRLISDIRAEPTGLRLDDRNKPLSETHATNQMQPEMQSGKARGQQQPPQPSPESYAEWGIGPVKHPHQPSRRTRPGWKFRRAFYRREYIYEDIRPPRPLRDRGFSRTYT